MNKLILSYSIFVSFAIGCSNNKQNGSEFPTEIINMSNITEYKVNEIPERYIHSKTYINFDNYNENYLFRGIDRIKIFQNNIYILDRRLKKLLVFDMDGYPVATIGNRGQGPGEYQQITDFDIDSRGNVYIIDGVTDKLLIYNSHFQQIDVKMLGFEIDVIKCIEKDGFLLGLSSWNRGKKAGEKVVRVDSLYNTIDVSLYYDKYVDDSFWISEYMFISSGDDVYYNRPIDNSVYLFTKEGGVDKRWEFDFGKKNVPNEDKKEVERNLYKYENYCCLKNFTIITDEYIVGTLWEAKETKVFYLDRNENIIYKMRSLADSDMSNFVGFDNGNMISYVYPGKYANYKNANLPISVVEHIVDNEGITLCLSKLK